MGKHLHGFISGITPVYNLFYSRLVLRMRDTTVGIVSIGDMGLGMAKVLLSHGYRVVTVGEGRRYAIVPKFQDTILNLL